MKSPLAFIFSKRWLGFALVALLVSIACIFLGRWQLHRYEFKDERAQLINENYTSEPASIDSLLATPTTALAQGETWRQVRLSGHYLSPALSLPKRPIEDSPADQVVALFDAKVGNKHWVIAINRGWYPTDDFTDHSEQMVLPEGEVTLTVHLRPAEAPSDRDLGKGQLHHIAPEQVVQKWQEAAGSDLDKNASLVTGAYGDLAAETPTTTKPPNILPPPSTSLGNHLSYTFQWWVFGIGAWVGLAVMMRREYTEKKQEEQHRGTKSSPSSGPPSPAVSKPARPGRREKKYVRPTGATSGSKRKFRFADEDVEDALVDSALARPAEPIKRQAGDQQASDHASETSSK